MLHIDVVGMIYKSPGYLDFMVNQFKKYCKSDRYTVTWFVVANDPTPEVLTKLQNEDTPYMLYHDPNPNDFYLNRVYRAWNFGGMKSRGEIVVFVNSDMAFTPGWLDNLVRELYPENIPTSLLVESGKLRSGDHAISRDFGRSFANYAEQGFLEFSQVIQRRAVLPGGLFMPCAFYTKDFIESGGYPEGNIYAAGPGRVDTPFVQSGDAYFFYNNPVMKLKTHITVFDSVVYHIQEGEKDA